MIPYGFIGWQGVKLFAMVFKEITHLFAEQAHLEIQISL